MPPKLLAAPQFQHFFSQVNEPDFQWCIGFQNQVDTTEKIFLNLFFTASALSCFGLGDAL